MTKLPHETSEESILEGLIEEAGELIQAAAKRLRILRGESYTPVTREENFQNLKEELADVSLVSDVLIENLGKGDAGACLLKKEIEAIELEKGVRWVERLNK